MQRKVLLIGAALFAIALLFPPWHGPLSGATDRFAFLFGSEPLGISDYGSHEPVAAAIDVPIWAVLLAGIAGLTATAYLALGLKNR